MEKISEQFEWNQQKVDLNIIALHLFKQFKVQNILSITETIVQVTLNLKYYKNIYMSIHITE